MTDEGRTFETDSYSQPPTAVVTPVISTTAKTVEMLQQTKPWVRFLSILGFICAGLMVVGGLLMGIAGLSAGGPAGCVVLVFYPVMGILYIFPSLYLYRYANHIGEFMENAHSQHLDSALEAQKSFWKFVGIMSLVMICIYAVVIVVAIIAGLVSAF